MSRKPKNILDETWTYEILEEFTLIPDVRHNLMRLTRYLFFRQIPKGANSQIEHTGS